MNFSVPCYLPLTYPPTQSTLPTSRKQTNTFENIAFPPTKYLVKVQYYLANSPQTEFNYFIKKFCMLRN